jgi:hypothetical protein
MTLFGAKMEILRQNPVNLYSFVGLFLLIRKQVIRNSINDDVFSKKSEQNKPNIDYMANEYSYEVLTKAHSYDISGGCTNLLLYYLNL